MKPLRSMLLAVATTAILILPAGAADPSPTASAEEPLVKVQAALSRHTQILTDLQARVPESSRADLAQAVEASRRAQEKAQAALGASGKPDVTGLQRARRNLVDNLQSVTGALQRAITKVPQDASARVQEALVKIQEQRAEALANFDRVIARVESQRMATERPERPDRSRPERPDKPDRPERPSPPDRPDRP